MNIKGINTYFYWIRLYPYRCNGPLGDSVKKNRTTTNSYWGKGVRSMDGLNIVKNYFCLGKFFVSVMWILYCFWGSTFLFGVLSYYFWYTMMPWLGISYRFFRENLANLFYNLLLTFLQSLFSLLVHGEHQSLSFSQFFASDSLE